MSTGQAVEWVALVLFAVIAAVVLAEAWVHGHRRDAERAERRRREQERWERGQEREQEQGKGKGK